MRKKKSESDVTTGFEDGRKRPQAKEYRLPLKTRKARKWILSFSLNKKTRIGQHLDFSSERLI